MESRRATWLAMSTADAAQADTAADAADPGKDTEAVGGSTPPPPPRRQTRPSRPVRTPIPAPRRIATLDADDQSILYTPLFTYAANPDANKTISFGNYLAALYAEIVTNDPATGLPEGVRRGVRGRCDRAGIRRDHPRGFDGRPARDSAHSAGQHHCRSRPGAGRRRHGQPRLPEQSDRVRPRGDVVYIVTDTATLAGLGAEYTVLRDYGDVFWSVRMNINDLTANFTTEFVLPEAPQYGVGRRG